MGTRGDDLPLDDTPIEHKHDDLNALDDRQERDRAEPDERDTAWYQFVGRIDEMLASGDYDWAHDSLSGISETVSHTHRVSEGQRRAVDNIERARQEPRRDGWRRRYEGR